MWSWDGNYSVGAVAISLVMTFWPGRIPDRVPTKTTSPGGALRRDNRHMTRKLVVVAALMFGFGYALIPVYKQICELTGINLLTPKDATVEPMLRGRGLMVS